jgi:hypothetical protein
MSHAGKKRWRETEREREREREREITVDGIYMNDNSSPRLS